MSGSGSGVTAARRNTLVGAPTNCHVEDEWDATLSRSSR